MQDDFRGKVVIVAGGAGGIGASQVRKLAAAGCRVAVADWNETAGRELVGQVGDATFFARIDVSSQDDWSALIDETLDRFGRIDGLSNSFGIAPQSTVEDLTLEDYSRVVAVNQTGTFLGIHAVIPHMRERGGGSIVNVASGAAYRALPYHFAYAATKAAIIAMTRDAAAELGAYNIRVNCISPGAIRTPLQAATVAAWQRTRASFDESKAFAVHPLGRIGEPDEVANAILFFLSDASSYCTGAALLVDGGAVAGQRA
jgi:3alpha(or 20beta)-hydroxysteroid dehydrogenase